jgi:nucleoside 2-deoxyribosyltransferase
VLEQGFDGKWFDCPNCGTIGITLNLIMNLRYNPDAKAKAAMLACERRIRKQSHIVLTEGNSGVQNGEIWVNFDEFLSGFPSSAYEMIERSLMNLAMLVSHPSQVIEVTQNERFAFFSTDVDGLFYILRQMNAMGWVTYPNVIPGKLTIEAKGWQRVEELTKNATGALNQAFVAMWFDESTQDIYEKAIKPAVEKTGTVKCLRIDELEHNNKICDQIVAEIRRSKYVVADFTGNRGGVYFEAGFAQGLGLPVVWTVKESDLGNVHFDTRQYNHIVYTTPEDLYEKLLSRIQATITE